MLSSNGAELIVRYRLGKVILNRMKTGHYDGARSWELSRNDSVTLACHNIVRHVESVRIRKCYCIGLLHVTRIRFDSLTRLTKGGRCGLLGRRTFADCQDLVSYYISAPASSTTYNICYRH